MVPGLWLWPPLSQLGFQCLPSLSSAANSGACWWWGILWVGWPSVQEQGDLVSQLLVCPLTGSRLEVMGDLVWWRGDVAGSGGGPLGSATVNLGRGRRPALC